jgi:hypothetical protein
MYIPSSLLTVDSATPVFTFRAVTEAFWTAAPDESRTDPESDAFVVCASAFAAIRTRANTIAMRWYTPAS